MEVVTYPYPHHIKSQWGDGYGTQLTTTRMLRYSLLKLEFICNQRWVLKTKNKRWPRGVRSQNYFCLIPSFKLSVWNFNIFNKIWFYNFLDFMAYQRKLLNWINCPLVLPLLPQGCSRSLNKPRRYEKAEWLGGVTKF